MKNKKNIIVATVLSFIYIAFLVIEKLYISNPHPFDRCIFVLGVLIFIFYGFKIGWKKMGNLCFKRRFAIAFLIFVYFIIMGYNTSSMYMYNYVIEPSYDVKDTQPVVGFAKSIRSDEYIVSVPIVSSQYMRNGFKSNYNDAIMGSDMLDISFYPRLPSLNLQTIVSPNEWGYLFLGFEKGLSYASVFFWVFTFLAVSELLLILFNGKKLVAYTIASMITFSPPSLWWGGNTCIFIGSLATIFFYYLITSKKILKKVLFSILLAWAGTWYILLMYPAWQVPYGYLFLCIFIYILYKNKNNFKVKDLLYLLLAISIIAGLMIPIYLNGRETLELTMNTVYPGARISTGGYAWELNFMQFSSLFFSVHGTGNPCEYAQFLSFYPLPLLWGIIQIVINYRKKKFDLLLTLLTVLGILLTIWNYVDIGLLISKITLLSMSTPQRAQLIVNIICILLIGIYFSDYANKKVTIKKRIVAVVVSIVYVIVGLIIANKYLPDYLNTLMIILSLGTFIVGTYLIIINTKYSKIIFGSGMMVLSVLFFFTIMPINKGVDILYEKPLAKQVQFINKIDPNAKWITTDTPLHTQNYILANGGRVINSTNFYPNMELWHKFDPEGEFDFVYNRYAHVMFRMIDGETNFSLTQTDLFDVFLNYRDVCLLDADYIATGRDLDMFKSKLFEKIYYYDGIFIFRTNCKKE